MQIAEERSPWESPGTLTRLRPKVASGEEASALTGVTGGSHLIDLDQEGVPIAVQVDSLDVLRMPGGVPLAPVLFA